MKKHTCSLPVKGCAWTMAMAIAFSSVPSIPTFAEEGAKTAAFVVTEFPEYKKAEDGTYEDKEFAETYKDLKAAPGTEQEELGLPKSISLNGYWEEDGPDILSTVELTELEWKLKSDTYELYSVDLPAGSYTFVPDLDAYTLPDEMTGEVLFDEIRLADGVTAPTMTVTLEEVQTEPETEAVSDSEAPLDDGTLPADQTDTTGTDDTLPADQTDTTDTDGTLPVDQTDTTGTDGTLSVDQTDTTGTDGTLPVDQTDTTGTDGTLPADQTDTTGTDDGTVVIDPPADDIISGTDDSLIGADGTVYVDGQPAASDSETPDSSDPNTDSTAPGNDITDNSNMVTTLPADDINAPQAIDINVALTLKDNTAGTAFTGIAYLNENGENVFTLKAAPAEGENTLTFQLPCNYPLSALGLTVTNPTTGINLTVTEPAGNLDYTDGAAKKLTVTDEVGTSYTLTLTAVNQAHNFSEATCTAPKTCSVCGTTEGDVADHQLSAATCTTPATCSVCGTTVGDVADHQLSAATCTAPATCSVCGTTVGDVAEHQLSAATCTAPAKCSVCGTTVGDLLPHNYSVPATCSKKATCSMCGAEDPNGQYADHTSSGEATCTDAETCTVCGQIITDALGHDWQDATCTDPKTCLRCGATEGKALGHDMQDDWLIEKESTDSSHGEEIRYCNRENCDHSETRPLNIIGAAERNSISGIENGANYNLKTAISFNANGSGMANTEPIDGDVRFVPSSWKVQNTPGKFKDNFSGAFSVSIAGSYTLTVDFRKQVYHGNWENTDVIDSKSVTFSAGKLVQGTPVNGSEDGIRINPQTGDNTVIIPLIILVVVALIAIIGAVFYKKRKK